MWEKDSQWEQLTTYTDITLPAGQQGELVELSWEGFLFFCFSHLAFPLVPLLTANLYLIWLTSKILWFPTSASFLTSSYQLLWVWSHQILFSLCLFLCFSSGFLTFFFFFAWSSKYSGTHIFTLRSHTHKYSVFCPYSNKIQYFN